MVKTGKRADAGTAPTDLNPAREPQLAELLDHGDPKKVLSAVESLFKKSFPTGAFAPVSTAFALAAKLFTGSFPGYRACNTEYHDYCHSLEVFSACSRLIDGAILSGLGVAESTAVDILVAALLHDSGYIQASDDLSGTGAKYTRSHVDRSAAFAVGQAGAFGLEPDRAQRLARLILGTDLARPWEGLELRDEAERLDAVILAAADLLGQMADRAYLEKLLFLYFEFREAGIAGYATAFDILKKTAGFYKGTVARLDGPLGAASGFARAHFAARYGVDRDLYREAIERQMAYLDGIMADDKANFRHKLKRLDLEAIERERHAS
jgi:hypothetical protein